MGGAAAVPYSLDSDVWKGGAPRMGAFDKLIPHELLYRLADGGDAANGAVLARAAIAGLRQRLPAGGRRCDGDWRRIAVTERQQTPETIGLAPGGVLTDQGLIHSTRQWAAYAHRGHDPSRRDVAEGGRHISLEDDEGLVISDGAR